MAVGVKVPHLSASGGSFPYGIRQIQAFLGNSQKAMNLGALVEVGHEKGLWEQHLPTNYEEPRKEVEYIQTIVLFLLYQ